MRSQACARRFRTALRKCTSAARPHGQGSRQIEVDTRDADRGKRYPRTSSLMEAMLMLSGVDSELIDKSAGVKW